MHGLLLRESSLGVGTGLLLRCRALLEGCLARLPLWMCWLLRHGHIALLGLSELISCSRLLRIASLRITLLRILTSGIGLLGITLLRITLLGITLLGITLLRITLLRIALLRIALWVALLRIALLRIALLRITLLGITLLRALPLRIALLGILPLHTRHIALLTGLHSRLASQLGHYLTDDTSQHAATHSTSHRVHTHLSWHTGLAIVLLLIARLTILLHGVCGLLSRINDVLE